MHWGPEVVQALKEKTLDGLMVNVDSGYMLKVHETAPHVLVSKDLWLGHLYLLPFESVEQAKIWTQQFVQWYNHQHKHSGLKFVTPAQRHDGKADAILRHRELVCEAARQRCPEHWSGATRNRKLKDEVWLNPERAEPELIKLAA